MTPDEVLAALKDPWWRIRNLYRVLTKGGEILPFRPWPEQERFLKSLHNRSIIVKARQRGFCQDPSTPILRADGRWAAIGDVRPGEELVGFDEEPDATGARSLRRTTVVATATVRLPAWRIDLEDGRSVICSSDHRWLAAGPGQDEGWRSLSTDCPREPLWVGDVIHSIVGEGDTLPPGWEGSPMPGTAARITGIAYVGERELVDLQTDAGTFVAAGLASHNSTLVQIVALDTALFVPNTRAAVIAQDLATSGQIFRDKVRLAYDNLPPTVRRLIPLERETASELAFGNGSSIRVATSVRGGTLQFLHISEFGAICRRYPERAAEIVTGSLPAVDADGIVVIESTAAGQEGAFYTMAQAAIAHQQSGKPLNKLTYRLHFASWWDAPEYIVDPVGVVISDVDHAYFSRIEAEIGRPIELPRRAWYVMQRDITFGGDRERMWSEYPSIVGEAFARSTEGSYYADQLAAARRDGRITAVPYQPERRVNTFWDLGIGDARAIWLHQRVGPRHHWIGYRQSEGEPYSADIKWLQSLGYVWDTHYLPHDAGNRRPGAEAVMTDRDMLEQLGLRNIMIVPRIDELDRGIQAVREAFATWWFDEQGCAEGLRRLAGYRKRWDERAGVWSDRPNHDGNSHAADAIRQAAQYFSDPPDNSWRKNRRNRSGMAI